MYPPYSSEANGTAGLVGLGAVLVLSHKIILVIYLVISRGYQNLKYRMGFAWLSMGYLSSNNLDYFFLTTICPCPMRRIWSFFSIEVGGCVVRVSYT